MIASAAALAAGASPPGPGGEQRYGVRGDGPVLWSWQTPLGTAATDDRILEFVRERCHHEPEEVADRAVAQIRDRGLRAGEVAILLQNFGMGAGDPSDWFEEGPALFGHWGDALVHVERPESDPEIELLGDEDADERWWDTVWMSHGIAETRDWMQRFIDRYQWHQAQDPTIPDPDRFHFDSEERVIAFRKWSTRTFTAMMEDHRWDTEPVPGFDGKTLAELYDEAGSPNVDPTREYFRGPNRDFAKWYGTVTYTVNEVAMKEAAYDPIRAAWPEVETSNYGSSARVDGEGTPRRVMRSNLHWWLEYWWESFGCLQAPVFYLPRHPDPQPGETPTDTAIRFFHERMPLHVFSNGGPNDDVTPWLLAIGYRTQNNSEIPVIDEEYTFRNLELMRSWGVDEILIWSDDSSQSSPRLWSRLPGILDGVWGPRLTGATLKIGESEDRRLSLLRTRWRDVAHLESFGIRHLHGVTLETRFHVPTSANDLVGSTLRLTTVTGSPDDPELRVRLRNMRTGRLVDGEAELAPDDRTTIVSFENGDRFRASDGTVEVELSWRDSRAFTVDLDLVQLTAQLGEPVRRPRVIHRRPVIRRR